MADEGLYAACNDLMSLDPPSPENYNEYFRPHDEGMKSLPPYIKTASVESLTRPDYRNVLRTQGRSTFNSWMLLIQTCPSVEHAIHSNPSIETAFKEVDKVITNSPDASLPQRCAYIHLAQLISHVIKVMRVRRQTGTLQSRTGRGDASIALDTYMQAQPPSEHSVTLRILLRRRIRIARRYSAITKASLLLVLMFGAKVDSLIKDFSVTQRALSAIAETALMSLPIDLVEASIDMSKVQTKSIEGRLDPSDLEARADEFENRCFM
ncbi:hypothetical protein EV126DRAFT_424290, partial [Verticillium dahliae]